MATPPAFFTARCEVRWSDLDPNGHARHTAFMDWATHCRVAAFAAQGLTAEVFVRIGVGPVLFREETDYLREVNGGDTITVSLEVIGMSDDYRHFRIRHVLRRSDGVHCGTVVVRGAWFDLRTRKVVAPPDEIRRVADSMPRADDYAVIEKGER
ncbi:MAG: acyl-CoA thioesterase [Planctomycetota bacterium]